MQGVRAEDRLYCVAVLKVCLNQLKLMALVETREAMDPRLL